MSKLKIIIGLFVIMSLVAVYGFLTLAPLEGVSQSDNQDNALKEAKLDTVSKQNIIQYASQKTLQKSAKKEAVQRGQYANADERKKARQAFIEKHEREQAQRDKKEDNVLRRSLPLRQQLEDGQLDQATFEAAVLEIVAEEYGEP